MRFGLKLAAGVAAMALAGPASAARFYEFQVVGSANFEAGSVGFIGQNYHVIDNYVFDTEAFVKSTGSVFGQVVSGKTAARVSETFIGTLSTMITSPSGMLQSAGSPYGSMFSFSFDFSGIVAGSVLQPLGGVDKGQPEQC